jgi:endogenous inhibitor of DNA gyrase (YacG/DUF329 family)
MSDSNGNGKAGARACPICGRPAEPHYRPFCSARCADIDLGRWLNESYRIPAGAGDEEEEADLPEGLEGDAEP